MHDWLSVGIRNLQHKIKQNFDRIKIWGLQKKSCNWFCVCVRNMEHHQKKLYNLFIMHVRNMQQKQLNKIGNFGLQTKITWLF